MLLPFITLMTYGGFKPERVYLAGVMTITGIFFMRLDLVYAGQIIPLKVVEGLKGVINLYTPTWSEWAVIAGAIGGAVLMLLLGEKKFALDADLEGHGHTASNNASRHNISA